MPIHKAGQMFTSFDFYSRVFHILVDFTTYDTVHGHGEAVKNKKKKAVCIATSLFLRRCEFDILW